MSLLKYKIFNEVVELGSLTQAAEKLNLSQSAVSHAIASLESEWGFLLLTRGRSGINLTNNGEIILRYTREIQKWNEQLTQEVAKINGLEIGTVRIGTFNSVSVQWLPEILKSFNENYPSIDIKLIEGDYAEIEHWIATGAIDFGFVSLPTTKSFETIPLTKDRMLCILPKNHPLSEEDQMKLDHFEKETFILSKTGSDNDVNRIFTENHLTPNIKFELTDDQAIISMVENGLGISILPEMVLYRLSNNIRILKLETEYYRTIGIAAVSFKTISPAAKKFIHSIQSWLSKSKRFDTEK